jgi:predicted GNAT family N-acyltransferase
MRGRCVRCLSQHYATQDQKRRVAAVFILPDDNRTVKGYYSRSSTNISAIALPEKLLRKLPKHPHQPATLLGRLAVNRRDQKQGIGEILLLDALRRSYILSEQIGSIAMVVDALNRNASAFYQQYGCIPLSDQSKLFMPMKTISQLFKQK